MAPQPEARAIADRFMYDTGNLKLLASQLPEGGLDRPVPALQWTVRQAFAHLAAGQRAYAETLERIVTRSAALTATDFDEPRIVADRAARAEPRALPSIVEDLDASLRRLVGQLNVMEGETLGAPVGDVTVRTVLQAWSNHAAEHAIQVLEALPELRGDPMLLNWLLDQDYSKAPSQSALQRKLFEDVRERYANEDDEMLDEDSI